jgi:PIN domain nuclease of toxin-antitoxin system
MTYVLDACALLAIFKREAGADVVDVLFQKALMGEDVLFMSIVNLLEVFYGLIGDVGIERAQAMMEPLDDTPLTVINTISQPVYQTAARLKGTYRRVSLADCIGLATAADFSGAFVTSDHHEIKTIEQREALSILWFR